ncbi:MULTISPECIES: hypothetical protein [Streptomyces]|uniref:hypothetical protein n=1 Tax=Streptomyces TaxID=1883 RepID=UPI001B38DE6A|nr:hypothetical protein [Streptomyces sp. RT42]MBQ0882592.1 hypothetical protein [Streptomyces sp. RT42]
MGFKIGRRMRRAATVAGAGLGATVLLTTQAAAWGGDWNGPGGGGGGTISFSSKTTATWDFTVVDTKSDGYCTRVKIIVDRPHWTDIPVYQPPVCGYQQGAQWKKTYSTQGGTDMRSLKIQQCRLHSDYSDETCQEVKRVYNPKY